MSAEKTDAIVLRTIEFSETSLIVTLFTRDFGRMSGMAKGARRAKNAFDNSLDLLSLCHLSFLQRSGDALHLLTEAKLQRRFRTASRSLEGLYCGYYVSELVRALTDEGDAHEKVFALIDETLQAIDADSDLCTTISQFELQLLAELGAAPSLERCVGCDRPIARQAKAFFGMSSGGVLCPVCRPRHRNVVGLRGATLESLEQLLQPAAERGEAWCVPQENRGEIRGVLSAYVSHSVGYRPKMHEFLRFLSA